MRYPTPLITLIFLLGHVATIGQGTGMVFNDTAYQQIGLDTRYLGERSNTLPPRVSLKMYCPFAGDQGTTGSCVGWACGYGAMTVRRAILEGNLNRDQITKNAHSAYYIYNQIQLNDCGGGAELNSALQLLQEKGDCLQQTFNDNLACSKKPQPADSLEALRYRIDTFYSIFELGDPPARKIKAIQAAIADLKPVIISMELPLGFQQIQKGKKSFQPTAGVSSGQGHALLVVGYDKENGVFEVMNSWGEDWADDGFVQISQATLGFNVRYAVVIDLLDTALDKKQQGFKVDLAYNKWNPDEETFRTVPVKLEPQKGIYFIQSEEVAVNDVFQLVMEDAPVNRFAYLIGSDENGNTKLFWPDSAPFLSSSLISEQKMTLPSADDALELMSKKDELAILFSFTPIPKISSLVQRASNLKGNLLERLQNVFAENWLDISAINYDLNNLSFSIEALPAGKVAPLILCIRED